MNVTNEGLSTKIFVSNIGLPNQGVEHYLITEKPRFCGAY